MPRLARPTAARAVALAAAAVTLAAAADPAGAQNPRMGTRASGLLRADSPVGTFPPDLSDPAIASAYNSVRDGINLNGIGVLQTIDPNDSRFAFFCTTQRIGRRTLITAAHCVTDELNGKLLRTANQASTFFIGPDNEFHRYDVDFVKVRPDWAGFGNPLTPGFGDVAVLNFATDLPSWMTTYDTFDEVIAPGTGFSNGAVPVTQAGFGTYGTGTGSTAFGDFNRRWGQNYLDFTGFFGNDDGVLYTNFQDADGNYDTTCQVLGPDACNPTRGAMEAGIANGDSGGPLFIGGRLAGVASFGTYWCDPTVTTRCVPFVADPARRFNSYGALNGYAPLAPNLAFIRASTIPEPSTVALVGAGVLGVAGMAARRRRVPLS